MGIKPLPVDRRDTFSEMERETVCIALEAYLQYAMQALGDFRRVKRESGTTAVDGHIAYWKNVSSGFRWALGNMRQRTVKVNHATKDSGRVDLRKVHSASRRRRKALE